MSRRASCRLLSLENLFFVLLFALTMSSAASALMDLVPGRDAQATGRLAAECLHLAGYSEAAGSSFESRGDSAVAGGSPVDCRR